MKTITTTLLNLVIPYFFILLFVYAAISKVLDFENFQIQIAQSPLLSAYANYVPYGVIILELAIALLLYVPKFRLIGLYTSFGIMCAFTVYIYLILNYSDFVPCSCGGILEKMGWTEHLTFNIGCVLIAALSVLLFLKKADKNKGVRKLILKRGIVLFGMGIVSSAFVTGLFNSSEHIIKKENNFTRRFPHHPIIEDKTYDLKVNSYYFAGSTDHAIYLGNASTPFRILKLDYSLDKIDTISITPKTNHQFQDLKYTFREQILYAYDGTVPVIYASAIDSLHQPLAEISYKEVYFDQLLPLSTSQFILRVEEKKTGKTSLAHLDLKQHQVNIDTSILTNKADGGFDADGKLLFDTSTGIALYLFYYRNQILKITPSLKLLGQMKTIDTVTKSQINVHQLKDGRKKMTSPPLLVNRNMITHQGLIFNESGLMGKHEAKDLWKNNAIVDIYRIASSDYWGSFYIQNRKKNKMFQMLATDSYFYILSGNEIVRYRYAQTLTNNFVNGGSRKPNPE